MKSGRGNWGCSFLIIWAIALSIFRGNFWVITASVVAAFILASILPSVVTKILRRRQENKKYREILHELMPKVQSINVGQLEEITAHLEHEYKKCCEPYRAVLRNAEGDEINICPICNRYLKMKKSKRENDLLECTNYPTCTFTRDFAEIFRVGL